MTNLAEPRSIRGRYSRGEETRQRIVDAAIDHFGRLGFAGTSTRDVSAAAGVNTPAIQYYFGGKLGLYNACIDRLTMQVWHRIRGAVELCQSRVAGGAELDEIIAMLNAVQTCLIDSLFSDDEGHAIRRLLAWEDVESGQTTSEEFMRDRIGLPILESFQQAVESVTSMPITPTEAQMHALSLMGLSMIFHFNQSRVLQMLDWSMDDSGLLDTLKAVAHQNLAFALTGLSQKRAAPVA